MSDHTDIILATLIDNVIHSIETDGRIATVPAIAEALVAAGVTLAPTPLDAAINPSWLAVAFIRNGWFVDHVEAKREAVKIIAWYEEIKPDAPTPPDADHHRPDTLCPICLYVQEHLIPAMDAEAIRQANNAATGETWRCPSCRDTTAPMGMCQRCGVFGLRYDTSEGEPA